MTSCLLSVAVVLASLRGIVIPVHFPDLPSVMQTRDVEAVADSVCAYYDSASLPDTGLTLDVAPAFVSTESYRKFGANGTESQDIGFHSLVSAAVRTLDQKVNFSLYDFLAFLVPGMSETDSGDEFAFWPRASSLIEENCLVLADGRKLDRYIVVCEKDSDGVSGAYGDFCHEAGHIFGLPDFYDTDGVHSGGLSDGLGGEYVLMDRGNRRGRGHNPPPLCALERYLLVNRSVKASGPGHYSLSRMEDTGEFLVVEGGDAGVVHFIANRRGTGLVVTMADWSGNPAGYSDYQRRTLTARERWMLNEINCRPDRKCALTLVSGIPAGNCVGLGNLAIASVGYSEDGEAGFDIMEPLRMSDILPLQTAVYLDFMVGLPPEGLGSVSLSVRSGDSVLRTRELGISGDGRFRLVESGLEADREYAFLIEARSSDGTLFQLSRTVRTRKTNRSVPPFILVPSSVKDAGGYFIRGAEVPLIVFNAPDKSEVEWSFDGMPVEGTDVLTVTRNGILEARLRREDGSVGIIRKRIEIR